MGKPNYNKPELNQNRGAYMNIIIKNRIEEFLSKEFYCSANELNGHSVIYTINTEAKRPYIKILVYRNCVAVCTSPDLHSKIKKLLHNKSRDEIFELPLVYGQTIHYVPNDNYTKDLSTALDYEFQNLFDSDILSLSGLTGFENALSFNENGLTSTTAIYIAKDKNKIIGIAGAAETSVHGLVEIGIDVSKDYREMGLGTYLVKGLTNRLLERNIIPFYSASITNIASQRTANRCNYIPTWIDTYGTILDGSSVYSDLVNGILTEFE